MNDLDPNSSPRVRYIKEFYRAHPDLKKQLAESRFLNVWSRHLFRMREILALVELSRGSGRPLALWGTGSMADIITDYCIRPDDDLLVIDGQPAAWGKIYRGREIHPPEALAENNIAGVILAVGESAVHDVVEIMAGVLPPGIKVARLPTESGWRPARELFDPAIFRFPDMPTPFDWRAPLSQWPPVLFVQESACIRSYKMAKALSDAGLTIDLAHFGPSHREKYGVDDSIFGRRFRLRVPQELFGILPRYKLVHCHNLPDRATYFSALFHPAVIQDVHDAASMRGQRPDWLALEREIFDLAAGYVFISGYQLEFAEALHGSLNRPTLLLPNYALAEAVPEKQMPKLSADNKGETHLCLVSGVRAEGKYRNLLGSIERLAGDGLHLHLHVPEEAPAYRALAERLEYFHYYPPLPYHELLKTLTRYDAGLMWFDYGPQYLEHLHATLPNRLFDYLAAGLPVITGRYRSSVDFVLRHNAGVVVSSEDEIPAAAHKIKGLKIDGGKFVMEAHLEELVDFYRNVLARAYGKRKTAKTWQLGRRAF